VQQSPFQGLSGLVAFNGTQRLDPIFEYYQLRDDGTFFNVGNFTNDIGIYLANDTLVFQSAGIPVSGSANFLQLDANFVRAILVPH
jgi:hypothetical protein